MQPLGMICKNDKTYLITNVKGYNITNNNIIYGDLNSSTISNNLLKHKLKHKVMMMIIIIIIKVLLSQKTNLQMYVSLVLI